ncbi:zf-4CXXC-R1 domain-containing protein [Mycena indigotica]|uniref:Zf-4CXXC-R1 domain-containing protein n=1 Tax=Mycena indigotica TaxID=2126181 RepID=A0A8H6TAW2_9AGAR|nr:zf-4CXXC-R1 domain-containing protein [Mycena indigotica]KAF7315395.1 zf-4CXXC-R1 domain-containing protein [Mycena indigotica]
MQAAYVLVPAPQYLTNANGPIMYPAPYPVATSSTLKRKIDYPPVPTYYYPAYPIPYHYQPAPIAWKKPKLTQDTTPAPPEETTLPPSYIYCHQCGKRRERDESAHCSFVEMDVVTKDRPAKTRRCHNKYCRSCLSSKYNEDLDNIKASIAPNQTGRIGEPYDFKCPKCRDVCSCWRCRKAKGLEPLGRPERKSKTRAEGTSKKPVAARHLPALQWNKLRTGLSVEDAEARLHIREFVLRFFSASIPKAHLEELEQIGGHGRSRFEDDDFVPWISEPCLKSVILAFLAILIEEETNGTIKKALQNGVKDLRAMGLGLSKIWQILSSLRDALDTSEAGSSDGNESDDSETVPSFPDPAPLPDSAKYTSRRTRSTGTSVVDTVQMIPVLLGLIDAVVETPSIRSELDNIAKEFKDLVRDTKEANRNVNDRWEKVKKEVDATNEQEFKARREAHKQLLKDIDGASKVAAHRFNPRFSPLGTDRDGRIYYALSPPVTESEGALEFISTVAAETDETKPSYKAKRKRKVKREEDPKSWSWFVAVHGTKPPAPLGVLPFKSVNRKDETDEESDDDESVDKWWAIDKPAEIRKLMTWISTKYRLDEDEESVDDSDSVVTGPDLGDIDMSPQSSRLELLALVGNLEDFVSGLEYRLRDSEGAGVLGLGDINSGKGKTKVA